MMFRLHIQHTDPARCVVIPFYEKNEAICYARARVVVIRYLYQVHRRGLSEGYKKIVLTEGEHQVEQFWPRQKALNGLYAPYLNTGFIYRRTFQKLKNRI